MKRMFSGVLRSLIGVAALAVFSGYAQGYPTKSVRVVIGFSPGGSADILARLVSAKLTESLGRQFIIDNRAGAGGTIGAAIVAKAANDGYTLFVASSSHAINATYYKSLPYDTVKDFSGVAPIAIVPYVLIVSTASGFKSSRELIERAKAAPGKMSFASSGNGTATHLTGQLFKTLAGIEILHVPYKGPAECLQEVLGRRIELTFVPVNSAKPFVDDGRLSALGMSTAQRSAALPNVPTIAESAIAGFEFTPWFGIIAPAGTPKLILQKLNQEIARAVKLPDVNEKLATQGAQPMVMTPEAFDALIRSEVTKLGRLVKESGAGGG
jgi:tripartite-type tricarboxylate transporter receptor subunit TctC